MSERLRNLIVVAAVAVMAGVLVALVATNPSDTDRAQSIGDRIRCPVCQGESIGDSPSQMAQDMMALIAERVADGQSDQAIIDELLSSYSGAVLLDPPVAGSTLVLWLAPLAALIVGGIVIIWWRGHPRDEAETAQPSRGRGRLWPLLALVAAFATIVVVAGFFLQDRDGPASGVANLDGQDLSDVSNETMEAVIAANSDNPLVDGMRLALAERYFEAGDYRSAFPQYLAVAESAQADDQQVLTALVRLGWMAWDGNEEAEAAIGLFDQALAIDPASTTALYLKGEVLWCGTDRPGEAADMFQAVLSDPDLPDESRTTVQADLDAVSAGEECK
jgi:cytochrome c-type biogenesis protein CcmH